MLVAFTHEDWAVVLALLGAILALIAALWESPYSPRLGWLAFAAVAGALAVMNS